MEIILYFHMRYVFPFYFCLICGFPDYFHAIYVSFLFYLRDLYFLALISRDLWIPEIKLQKQRTKRHDAYFIFT